VETRPGHVEAECNPAPFGPAARVVLLAALGICGWTFSVAAQDAYPARPIRLIVPFPPGGPTDVMGRLISQGLSNQLGQQVYVDNRPGAGSTLAAKIAANAEPDGYTLLLGSAATLAVGPAHYRDAEYDPKSLCRSPWLPRCPYVMVASPKAPISSFSELIAYAKAHSSHVRRHAPYKPPKLEDKAPRRPFPCGVQLPAYVDGLSNPTSCVRHR
jgi:tripartite-type tricarboxylate transporter receptor subunit TctC